MNARMERSFTRCSEGESADTEAWLDGAVYGLFDDGLAVVWSHRLLA